MKLRIVSGTLSRRYITVDKSSQGFRPTQERVRRAVADALRERIPGAAAADFCAGSGAFGIELISRGAASVDFVESDRRRASAISRMCGELGITNKCRVFTKDIRNFPATCDKFYDVIFFDPPYEDTALAELVPDLCKRLSKGGMLVYEREKSSVSQGDKLSPAEYDVEVRNYGDTAVEFITKVL
ncbi:MAG TPA: RsmD family RNA methyltransferase [Chitinivibrionales bacterium]|nr:RsmD family RNA methyltransferase [Chitinivibrionales bacterium]